MRDVKGIQDVLDVLVPDDGDEVVVILTRTVNSEVPLSALAVEEQDDAGGEFDGQSVHDHVKNWDNHGDEADDQRP